MMDRAALLGIVAFAMPAIAYGEPRYYAEELLKTVAEESGRPLPLDAARNVVVLIGDGMGLSTLTAARIFRGDLAGDAQQGETSSLALETLRYSALLKTYSSDALVTDSAAAGECLFCFRLRRFA